MKNKPGKLFVLSGPSGSGKTTLLKHLLRAKGLKGELVQSVSLTTRPKRSGEREAKDYFFVTERGFRQRQAAQKILEWTKYLGYYYATPKDTVGKYLKAGKHIGLCLDLKGALKVKRLYPKSAVTLFILPPSLKALEKRIEKRCHKTKKEEVVQRLRLARKELAACRTYDYWLVNKNLSKSIKALTGIVLKEIKKQKEEADDTCSYRKPFG